jgi:hypothetical protein
MKAALWIGGACLVLLVLICAIMWSRNFEVRVPKDFRGLVRIRPDPAAPAPKVGFFKLVVQVPESGEVTLPSLDVVRRMHHQKASFSDGSPLQVALPGDVFSGIALQVMNTPPTQQVFYFVGTREELITYLKEDGDRLYTVHQ